MATKRPRARHSEAAIAITHHWPCPRIRRAARAERSEQGGSARTGSPDPWSGRAASAAPLPPAAVQGAAHRTLPLRRDPHVRPRSCSSPRRAGRCRAVPCARAHTLTSTFAALLSPPPPNNTTTNTHSALPALAFAGPARPAMLYLTADKFPVFVPLGIIGFYRYFWYLIRLAAAFVYRPVPPPLNPTYIASEDVTIIVPTIDAGDEFKEAAFSWLQSNPAEVIIVTETKMVGPLQQLANQVDPTKIRVVTVPKANKRLQMVEGVKHTSTDIIVFADDDSIWPPTMLQWMLACFEDQQVGGVGTSQRVKSTGAKMTVWETLAAFRLSIRNFEIASSTHIDGGVPCLSGRTAAYRTVILKDPAFIHGFTNDYWLGKYLLNSGDDKFLTRWMVSHGWNTYIQVCPEVELLSTMKPDWRFLKQVLRWTRNTWRSDIRSVFTERHIWTRHPYTCYTMLDKFINPFTLLSGPALVLYLLSKTATHRYHLAWWDVILSYIVWITATRTLKLLPHLWFRPLDIIYVPAYIAFGYYFAIMKLYALCTLNVTAWGTRAGVGEPAEALSSGQEKDASNMQTQPASSPPAPDPSSNGGEDTYYSTGAQAAASPPAGPRGQAQAESESEPEPGRGLADHTSRTGSGRSHYYDTDPGGAVDRGVPSYPPASHPPLQPVDLGHAAAAPAFGTSYASSDSAAAEAWSPSLPASDTGAGAGASRATPSAAAGTSDHSSGSRSLSLSQYQPHHHRPERPIEMTTF